MLLAWLALSPWTLIIGAGISAVSIIDSAVNAKNWKERIPKLLIAVFSMVLLFVQARSNKRTSIEADNVLQSRLQQQKHDLTEAFRQDTAQILKLSAQEADETRKAANDQTRGIRGHVATEETALRTAALGTDTCPGILASIYMPFGRPHALAVFNLDKCANMYDIAIRITEFGPGAGGVWSQVLQKKTLTIHSIPPERASTLPFDFVSKTTVADMQVEVSTRGATCNGRLELRDEGNNVWRNDAAPMYKNGKLQFDSGDHKLDDRILATARATN